MIFPDATFADEEPSSRLGWIREHRSTLERVPAYGEGRTVDRLQALAALAARDGSLALLVRAHLDALAVRDELGSPARDDGLHGLWTARPELLRATRRPTGWRLTGCKPWCAGASAIDRALVTAGSDDGLLLFDVPVSEFSFDDDWDPSGLRAADARTGLLDTVAGEPLGAPGGYVERSGFWHGGVGVAACWLGLARRIAADLVSRAAERDEPHLRADGGECEAVLAAAGALLGAAGRRIDDRPHSLPAARARARTVRTAVDHAARRVLQRAASADDEPATRHDRCHARALADLGAYLGSFQRDVESTSVPVGPDNEWWTA